MISIKVGMTAMSEDKTCIYNNAGKEVTQKYSRTVIGYSNAYLGRLTF